MNPEKLVFFGGHCLTNELLRISDSGNFWDQKVQVFDSPLIQKDGRKIVGARKDGVPQSIRGSIANINQPAGFTKTLLSIKSELDTALNSRNRFIRTVWDYHVFDKVEDINNWYAKIGVTDLEIDSNNFQWGKGSLKFSVNPEQVNQVKNGDFEDFTDNIIGSDLISNGDMELDSNWSDWGSPTSNTRSSDEAHGDTYSRKFVGSGVSEGIQSDTFTVGSANLYRIEAWVKPEDNEEIGVWFRKGDDSGYELEEEFYGLNRNEWNKVVLFVRSGFAGNDAYVAFGSKTAGGTWYIDDVSIMEVDNSTVEDWVLSSSGDSKIAVGGAEYKSDNFLVIGKSDPQSAKTNVILEASTEYMIGFKFRSFEGRLETKIKALDGTDEYLQDDGATWNSTDNTLADIEGDITENQWVYKYMRFTTKDFQGEYELLFQNGVSSTECYIADVLIRESVETRITMIEDQMGQWDEDSNSEVSRFDYNDAGSTQYILDQYIDSDGYIYIHYCDYTNRDNYLAKYDSNLVKQWEVKLNSGTTSTAADFGHVYEDQSGYLWVMLEKDPSEGRVSKVTKDGIVLLTDIATGGGLASYGRRFVEDSEGLLYVIYHSGTYLKRKVVDKSTGLGSDDTNIGGSSSSMLKPSVYFVDDLFYIFYITQNLGYDELRLTIYNQDWTEYQSEIILIDENEGVQDGLYDVAINSKGEIWVGYIKRISGSDSRATYRKFTKYGNSELIAPTELSSTRVLTSIPSVYVDRLDNFYVTYAYLASPYDIFYTGFRDNGDTFIVANNVVDVFTNFLGVVAWEDYPTASLASIYGSGLSVKDMTDMGLQGSFGVIVHIPDPVHITHFVIRVGSDEDNFFYSRDLEANYEGLAFDLGDNLLVENWEDMTEVGAVDLTQVGAYFEVGIYFDDGLKASLEDFRLDMPQWNNEDETRNWESWLKSLKYNFKERKLLTYSAQFLSPKGIGESTFRYNVLSEQSLGDLILERSITFGGSAKPLPIMEIDFTAVTGIGSIQLTNVLTGENMLIDNLSLNDNDILTIDHSQPEVSKNNTPIFFKGWPEWGRGVNNMRLQLLGSSGETLEQLDDNTSRGNGTSGEEYISESFTPADTGSISSFFLQTSLFFHPSAHGWVYICADRGDGTPGTILGTGWIYAPAYTEGFYEVVGLESLTLNAGTQYHFVFQTTYGGYNGYVRTNSGGGFAGGSAYKASASPPWNFPPTTPWTALTGEDVHFSMEISANPSAVYNLDVLHKKRYH